MPLEFGGLGKSGDELIKGFGRVVLGIVYPDELTTDSGLVEIVPLAANEDDRLVQGFGVVLEVVEDPVEDCWFLEGSGWVPCRYLVVRSGRGDRGGSKSRGGLFFAQTEEFEPHP